MLMAKICLHECKLHFKGVIKCKSSTFFQKLCDLRKSMRVLSLLGYAHSLELGLDLKNTVA